MKVIFDNNVIISASIFWNSIPAKALVKARQKQNTILSSQLVLAELRKTLLSSKFDQYLSFSNRIDFCETFTKGLLILSPTRKINECRDPKDNIYLELALTGNADCIITGDQDMLVLNPFRGIPIITPKLFLDDY